MAPLAKLLVIVSLVVAVIIAWGIVIVVGLMLHLVRFLWSVGVFVFWAYPYKEGAAKSESGIGHALVIVGYLLTAGAALLVSIQDTSKTRREFVISFTIAGGVALLALLGMLHAREWEGLMKPGRNYFDRPSFQFIRGTYFCGFIFVLWLTSFGLVGWLPGQTPKIPTVFAPSEVIDSQEIVEVRYRIEAQTMPDGAKDRVAAVVTLNSPARTGWRIKEMKQVSSDYQVVERVLGDPLDPDHLEGFFGNLTQSSQLVVVLTRKKSTVGASSRVVKESIMDGYGMSLLNLPRPERIRD